ncbi:MAG TPA: hypothetical protein VK427_14980 [Kofleriaceae bacterium]|nr:hypothetical protein [Kofleriaceae bacterium]
MKSILALSMLLFGACVVGEEVVLEHEGDEEDLEVLHEDDPIYDEGPAGPLSSFNIGGWNPSAEVRAAGDAQWVACTGAGAWAGGANCGGGLLAGTREIADYLKARFAGMSGYGGYACRPNTANTSQMSVHGTGRALDIMIPLQGGDADNTRGDKIANFLVQNAQAMGIQFIIWDRNDWGASRPSPKLSRVRWPEPAQGSHPRRAFAGGRAKDDAVVLAEHTAGPELEHGDGHRERAQPPDRSCDVLRGDRDDAAGRGRDDRAGAVERLVSRHVPGPDGLGVGRVPPPVVVGTANRGRCTVKQVP